MITFKQIRKTIKDHVHLYKALVTDARTPMISKILLGIAIWYMLIPFDFIPDFIPVLGQIDDVIIIPLVLYFALKFIPYVVYKEHADKILEKK